MNTYLVLADTSLYRDKFDANTVIGTLEKGQHILGTPVPGHAAIVQLRLPDLSDADVYVDLKLLTLEPAPAPEPIADAEVDAFCRLVTGAAADQGAGRDTMMAIAFALSDTLKDFGPGEADEVGPFRFSAPDWSALIASEAAGKLGRGLTEQDRYRWECQPDIAALRLIQAGTQLASQLGAGHPTRTELFFALRFGAGAEALLAGDRTAKCRDAIGAARPGSYAASLKSGNATIGEALQALREPLETGYAAAKPVIDRQPVEVQRLYPALGVPAWLALARNELSKGVAEIPGSVDNPDIMAYAAAAGLHGATDRTAWCGTFVTYCMLKCGDDLAGRRVKTPDSAAADWWCSFGDAAPHPAPPGTIVALRLLDDEKRHHVGFLEEGSNDQTLRLLAGNQGDRVGIANWKNVDAVFRVPSGWTAAAPGAEPVPAGKLRFDEVPLAAQPMAKKIAAAFGAARYGVIQQAAAVANAWMESSFNPTEHNSNNEDSVGLFQFNRRNGEGVGHTVAELQDPDRNIQLTIDIFRRRIPEFATATTIEQAIRIFVMRFERPKDSDGAIAKRLEKARLLLG